MVHSFIHSFLLHARQQRCTRNSWLPRVRGKEGRRRFLVSGSFHDVASSTGCLCRVTQPEGEVQHGLLPLGVPKPKDRVWCWHNQLRVASLLAYSLPHPHHGSLPAPRNCGGLTTPPGARAGLLARLLAQRLPQRPPPPQPHSWPQPQRWNHTHEAGDEGHNRGRSAHPAPRAGRPRIEELRAPPAGSPSSGPVIRAWHPCREPWRVASRTQTLSPWSRGCQALAPWTASSWVPPSLGMFYR